MYEYQSALVKHRLPDVRFEVKDVRALSVKALLRDYAEVYIVLTHPSIEGKVTLILSEIPNVTTPLEESVTVSQWLTTNGNGTLATHVGVPVIKENAVLARDVWQAGYVADLCVASGSPYNDATDYDKTDIWFKRAETNYQDVLSHCLGTVNGLFHRLDADNDGVYIKDGGITFRRSQRALLGLVSFLNVGKVHTASITPDMVYNPDPTKLYSNNFYVKVPFDTSNKIMGIVIGGYLHLATPDVKVIGSHSMNVKMSRIPFLERYMESRYLIDQTSMERFHEVSEDNLTDYDLQGFYSNECILELLGLSQSFIVGIEVDHLLTDIIQCERTALPGRFYHTERPLFPLRTQLGMMPSYISEDEAGKWVIRIDNNLRQHRFMNTRDFRWQPKVDEKRISHEPATFQRGDLVKWFNNSVTIEKEEE